MENNRGSYSEQEILMPNIKISYTFFFLTVQDYIKGGNSYKALLHTTSCYGEEAARLRTEV